MNSDMYLNILRERDKQEKEKKLNFQAASALKLKKTAEKKIKTTFIGAVDSIEKRFGFLWGQGKKHDELTEDQRDWLRMWEDLRKEILDKGNNQLRAMRNEIDNYNIEWKRYKYNLLIGQGD